MPSKQEMRRMVEIAAVMRGPATASGPRSALKRIIGLGQPRVEL
jgi:hypothetical protein